MSKTPVTIITGYLGSGKTTLMNELLKQNQDKRIALIVNDLGSVNVDSNLIKSGNVIENETLREMTGGCICCTLRDKFMSELQQVAVTGKFDSILVEASGVSNPTGICQGFMIYEEQQRDMAFYLNNVVSVVDASRIFTEFLDDISKKGNDTDDSDIVNLVMDQIEFCNVLILNKCDLLIKEDLEKVRSVVKGLQPDAKLIEAIQGKVDTEDIFNSNRFDFYKVLSSSTYQKSLDRDQANEKNGMDDFGITSFVFKERKPFNYKKFSKFLDNYPKTLIRSKGYVWFSNKPKIMMLFEQAGKNLMLTGISEWVASYSKKERDEIFSYYPKIKEDWDEKYGDRNNELVLIGRDYNRDAIINSLNDCIDNRY
ncbi:MAG: GTP-binding protein [Candidatus Methanomethylophilaceae archaeon]|nr:GTP-binding protein [Candidatus Methanomethylophilaceae archaeon]